MCFKENCQGMNKQEQNMGFPGPCREREIGKVKFVALWQGRKIVGEKPELQMKWEIFFLGVRV